MSALPIAQMSDILRPIERIIEVQDDQGYKLVGVRWYGEGAFLRETKRGRDIRRKQQWGIRENDVVYNKLFAWRGSFAIVDTKLDGCIVSDKFPTYRADLERVLLPYLAYYFQTTQIQHAARQRSIGAASTSKFTLNPPQFLELPIPLPSLGKQRRIVARLDSLLAEVDSVKKEIETAVEKTGRLWESTVNESIGRSAAGCDRIPFVSLLTERLANGESFKSKATPPGIPILTLSAATFEDFGPNSLKYVQIELPEDSRLWLKPGDLLISRSNTIEYVGRAAVYEGEPEGCIYPDLMIRARLDSSRADVHFVKDFFRTQEARRFIVSHAKGSSSTMQKISQWDLREMLIPDVPIDRQRVVAKMLKKARREIEAMHEEQTGMIEKLSRLRASLLDTAFRGEL